MSLPPAVVWGQGQRAPRKSVVTAECVPPRTRAQAGLGRAPRAPQNEGCSGGAGLGPPRGSRRPPRAVRAPLAHQSVGGGETRLPQPLPGDRRQPLKPGQMTASPGTAGSLAVSKSDRGMGDFMGPWEPRSHVPARAGLQLLLWPSALGAAEGGGGVCGTGRWGAGGGALARRAGLGGGDRGGGEAELWDAALWVLQRHSPCPSWAGRNPGRGPDLHPGPDRGRTCPQAPPSGLLAHCFRKPPADGRSCVPVRIPASLSFLIREPARAGRAVGTGPRPVFCPPRLCPPHRPQQRPAAPGQADGPGLVGASC